MHAFIMYNINIYSMSFSIIMCTPVCRALLEQILSIISQFQNPHLLGVWGLRPQTPASGIWNPPTKNPGYAPASAEMFTFNHATVLKLNGGI